MTRCHEPFPIYTIVLTGKNLPANVGYRPRISENLMGALSGRAKREIVQATKHKLVQTMFRDSEAQTDPYRVEVAETTCKGLEILTLGWLSWNNGLPAGMNEILAIERARQKRAWEASLPIPTDESSRRVRSMIISAVEINEWNYRESLIAGVSSLRMELAEKMLREKTKENKIKYEDRLARYVQKKREERSMKLQKLRLSFNRKVRKLIFARQNINRKYHRWNVVEQFADKTSELYAPQMRFGEDPRHWHEKISPKCGYWRVFQKLEILNHTMGSIPTTRKPNFDYEKHKKPKKWDKELCIRSTKWTEQNLEKLQEELKNLRRRRHVALRPCNLKKKVFPHGTESETPSVLAVPDEDEEMFQACLFLQKTIKGRAIQAVMFEGRVKCQELIEELKSTHALQSHMESIKTEMRKKIYGLQREAEMNQMKEKRKNEVLASLEGKTTADMLDFLAKELLRLQDERVTHAYALLADQERHKREAVEAGRRQQEEQRRREHDEMFKQILKMHQNSVQAFLEDAMVENRAWLAERDAREYVTETAKKIDLTAKQTALLPFYARADDVAQEEIVADLIHNFALPEAEKIMVRTKMKANQRNYLKICHDEVYASIDQVVKGLRNRRGKLLPVPLQGKHKIPPIVRVKYLRLKRMHESSSSSETQGSQNSENSVVDETFIQARFSKFNIKEKHSEKEAFSSGFSKQDIILEREDDPFTEGCEKTNAN